MVVIGTVGYGNVYPQLLAGKVLASVTIFVSSLFMAIPMTIIIKRWGESYDVTAREGRVRKVFGGSFVDGKMEVWLEERRRNQQKEHIRAALRRYRTRDTWLHRLYQYLNMNVLSV